MKPAIGAARSRNFHVPMPDELYRALHAEAARIGRPATAIVRDAVERYLEERRREALRDELSAYAERWAGTEIDLDPALERAGVEHVRSGRRSR